ncbi:MAG TPA: glycosyltransferase family 87 protein [Candidatus Obscuribacterales bacterium]
MAAVLAPVIPVLLIVQSRAYFGQVSDLPHFYAAARLILAGQGAQIYNVDILGAAEHQLFPEMGQRVVRMHMPPLAVPLLVPLGMLPVGVVDGVWTTTLVLALVASVVALKRIFALSAIQALWLSAVLSIWGPAFEAVRIGQLAPLQLLALSLAVGGFRKGQDLLAGLLLSILLLKPQQLIPLAVYLIGCRRYRAIAALVASSAVLAVLSLVLFGPGAYQTYFGQLAGSVEQSIWLQPELNPTFRGQLLRIFPYARTAVAMVSFALAVVALAAIFMVGRTRGKTARWLEAGLIAALPLGLITSLHCHDYDLLLLLPTVAALLKQARTTRLPPWLPALSMICLLPYLLPVYTIVHNDYVLAGAVINPLFLSLLTMTCILEAMELDVGQDSPKD